MNTNVTPSQQPQRQRQQQIRQGDLLFVRQATLPADVTLSKRPTGVILEGETTGHAHRLTQGAVLDAPTGAMWLEVLDTPTEVRHEEHHTVTLDPGVWIIIRQREYVAPDVSRTVVD